MTVWLGVDGSMECSTKCSIWRLSVCGGFGWGFDGVESRECSIRCSTWGLRVDGGLGWALAEGESMECSTGELAPQMNADHR